MTPANSVSAIVLTGGRSARLSGTHKPGVVIGNSTIIDSTIRVLSELEPRSIIVCGSPAGLSPDLFHNVEIVAEDPPFGGPLAGVARAVQALPPVEALAADAQDQLPSTVAQDQPPSADARDQSPSADARVLLLAGDMPFIDRHLLTALLAGIDASHPVAASVEDDGRIQYLSAAWQHSALVERVHALGTTRDQAMRRLYEGVTIKKVPSQPRQLLDIDTPDDLATARQLAEDAQS